MHGKGRPRDSWAAQHTGCTSGLPCALEGGPPAPCLALPPLLGPQIRQQGAEAVAEAEGLIKKWIKFFGVSEGMALVHAALVGLQHAAGCACTGQ